MAQMTLEHTSLPALLRDRAARWGDRPLFRFREEIVRVHEANERSARLARVLHEWGIGHGDRVAVMMGNGTIFPIAWFAIARLGAVMVPVNAAYRANDLRHVLEHSGAAMVLTDTERHDIVASIRGQARTPRHLRVLGDLEHDASLDQAWDDADPWDGPDPRPEDLMNIQYTSGTTGLPKGCMLSHRYWLLLGRLAADTTGFGAEDVALTAQPFSYIDPQWNTMLCLTAGATLAVLPRFSASTFWRSIVETGATFCYMVGTMPVMLAAQPISVHERAHRLRLVSCSGIVPNLHAEFERRWGVPWREAYGMTETGVDLFFGVDATDSVGSGAMGLPAPSKEVRIVDPVTGKDLPSGSAGELIVRGEPMMLGYWNDPEATAETIRDGWLHTGDLVTADDRGWIHIVGRRKEMIRRGGENIAAAEVEAVLAECPLVRASAVVGIPDDVRGEEVKAFVLPRADVQPGEEVAREIVAFVRERLARFKTPRFVEFVDAFPLTPSERVAKPELMARPDQRGKAFDLA